MVKNGIFFDRDGVLNKNIYYKEFKQYEAPILAKDLKINNDVKYLTKLQKIFYIFIITNQPSAAKKKTTFKELNLIKKKFLHHFRNKNIVIKEYLHCLNTEGISKNYCKKFEYCPYMKKSNQICKKPSNSLIEYCMLKYNLERKKCFFVGDRKKDMLAAKKSKINFIFFKKKEILEKVKRKNYLFQTNNLKRIVEKLL